jgi:hypothetical protein
MVGPFALSHLWRWSALSGHFDDLVTALALAVFAARKPSHVPIVAPPHIPKSNVDSFRNAMGYGRFRAREGEPMPW